MTYMEFSYLDENTNYEQLLSLNACMVTNYKRKVIFTYTIKTYPWIDVDTPTT